MKHKFTMPRLDCKKPNALDWLFIVVLLIFIVAFVILAACGFLEDQANLFLLKTDDFFADYFHVCEMSCNLNPYFFGLEDLHPEEHAYPPLNYVIFYFLAQFADYAHLSAFEAGYSTTGLTSAFIVVIVWLMLLFSGLRQAYKKQGILATMMFLCILLSSVVLFSIERANIILLSAACMAFFVVGYRSPNKVIRELSLICLAIATALKGYPALMGMLLLYDKQIFAAIRCAIYAVVLIFLPFLALEGGFSNIPIWLHNISANSDYYKHYVPAFGFGVFTEGLSSVLGGLNHPTLTGILNIVCKIVCVMGLLTCFALKRYWQKVLLLGLCLISLQTNSAEYLGLYLLVGMMLFFSEKEHKLSDVAYVIAFIVLLCPLQIISFSGQSVTFFLMGCSANALLVVLTCMAVKGAVSFVCNNMRSTKNGN